MFRSHSVRSCSAVAGWLILAVVVVARFSSPAAAAEGKQDKDTFWFIPHTHWEGAVFKTREEYLEMGLQNILRAIALLKAHPNYRFALDQACYVKPFLERYPEQEAAVRRLIAEGRLEIVGGTDVMADVNMPSGESFVRQVLYGKGYFRRKLGIDVAVGWQLDTFGHHAQMPQLLKLGGYRSFWFFRGVANWDVPSEFIWQGLDGSRVPAFWLPQGYAILYGSSKKMPEFAAFVRQRFQSLNRQARGRDRAGPAGADVCEPEEHVPGLVEQFNRAPDAPFHLRLAVPTEFEKAVAARTDRPVVQGELNPIFQGAYSSRIELKQTQRDLERLLTTAEKLAAIGQALGSTADSDELWPAWEPVLFNQTHDLASGVMTDRVYDDTLASYGHSRRLVDGILEDTQEGLASRIDTQGEGTPIVVWNALGWPRDDVATVDLGFTDPVVQNVVIEDAAGRTVPSQIVSAERYAGGGLLRAKVAFLARGVPALGYAVYRARPAASAAEGKPAPAAAGAVATLENDFCRAVFDPATGAMTSLVLKPGGQEISAGPANVVCREHDGGDLWELYRPLDGGSRIAMTRKQPVPQKGTAAFSHESPGDRGMVLAGPVFSEFRIAHPWGSGRWATTVRMYAGLKRLDIQTRITNQEKHVRYQALFPTTIRDGRNVHEIPFGAVERPAGIEFPAQNWADYGDGKLGLAVLNRGLPGNLVSDGTMMLSLMRSTRIVAYGFGGGYEPGMSSDSGLELGKELVFDYALAPHVGDWREALVYRQALEFNNPLVARKTVPHPGSLPKQWGLLEIAPDCPNVLVSALKSGPGGSTVLRLYEAAGKASPGVRVALRVKLVSAEETDLLEDPGRKLEVKDNAVQLDLRPFEIKTLKLGLQAEKSAPVSTGPSKLRN